MRIRGQLGSFTRGVTYTLGLGCLVLDASCLVTNDADFKVANSPPSVTIITPTPYTTVPQESDKNCGPPTNDKVLMEFSAQVIDNDVDQRLLVRLLVNGVFNQGGVIAPAPGATEKRAPTRFCVDVNAYLNINCSVVDIVVTSEFANSADPAQPLDEGDVGRERWYVVGGALNSADADRSSCLSLYDAGVVP